MWSLQLKFLLFIMSPVNTKLELELEFVSWVQPWYGICHLHILSLYKDAGTHLPWVPEVFLACGGKFFGVGQRLTQFFGHRPKPWAAKLREKPLAWSSAFYRSRWPLNFFIGLHLCQSDWKFPTVIMWAGKWRNVQRPTLSLVTSKFSVVDVASV